MADYTTGTGSGGILLIRDQGYNVEFHVQSGQSATFGNGLPWNGYVNGVNVGGSFNYPKGRPWVHIATYGVGYNQSVKFGIGKTGTQGLGGPTDLWVSISRATVPPPPAGISITNIGHNTLRYQFGWTGDGGSPVVEYQVGYGYDPSNVQYYTNGPANGILDLGGLAVGSTVYIWVRARNAVGWSGFSNRLSATLLRGGRLKVNGAWSQVVPYVKKDNVWRGAEPMYKASNGVWRVVEYV